MKRATRSLMFLIVAAAPCFAHHIAVVVDKQNTVRDIASAELSKICKGELASWPNGRPVVLVLHRASSDELHMLQRLTRWSESDVKSFILQHPRSVKLADSDAAVLNIVQATPGAVGFVEARSINDGVNVLKIDSRLPLEAGYLSH